METDKLIIEPLLELGFTLNEAKVLIFILKNPESNGYNIAKKTGMSRSMIYGILEKLNSSGFIYLSHSSSLGYISKSFEEIKDLLSDKLNISISKLKEGFSKIHDMKPVEAFITIKDFNNQLKKMNYMIRTAKNSLFINAGIDQLKWIDDSLSMIDEKIDTHIFSFSNIDKYKVKFKTYSKNPEDHRIQKDDSLKNVWRILIIKDKNEMFLCGGEIDRDSSGIWTTNKMMVKFAIEHFVHNVKIYNIEKNYKIDDYTQIIFQ